MAIIAPELAWLACLVTRQSLNLQCYYSHCGHGAVAAEDSGLSSFYPSARPRSMARALGSSSGRRFLARHRSLDDHPRRQPPRGSGAKVAGADLTKMFCGAGYFSFLATYGDDEHRKFDAFIKNNETAVFRLTRRQSPLNKAVVKCQSVNLSIRLYIHLQKVSLISMKFGM